MMADDRDARIAQLGAKAATLREREATLTHDAECLLPALAEAAEQRAATAEIPRVVVTSRSAAMPVFEAVTERPYQLCQASSARLVACRPGSLIAFRLTNSGPEAQPGSRR
jgi:hypothetical protein